MEPDVDSTCSGRPVWRKPDGTPVSCTEKIKVLNQNLDELRQVAQDALDDAILMGCSEVQIKAAFIALLENLRSAFAEGSASQD